VQILLHRPCELVNGRLQRSQALIQQPPRVVAYDDDRQVNHKPDFISKTGSQRLRNRVFQNKPGSVSGEEKAQFLESSALTHACLTALFAPLVLYLRAVTTYRKRDKRLFEWSRRRGQ
jgi:hypothetical protein